MKKQNEAEKLKTILVIVTGFLVLYFLSKKEWLFIVAISVALITLIIPSSQKLILWIWDKIAHVLGWINTRILLTLVFYLFLYPVSLIARIKLKNLLQLKKQGNTVFEERNHLYTKEDLENPW